MKNSVTPAMLPATQHIWIAEMSVVPQTASGNASTLISVNNLNLVNLTFWKSAVIPVPAFSIVKTDASAAQIPSAVARIKNRIFTTKFASNKH